MARVVNKKVIVFPHGLGQKPQVAANLNTAGGLVGAQDDILFIEPVL